MYIRGIILAGGASKRMGRNKLQLDIYGDTIIQSVINNAKESKLNELMLVCGKYDVKTDVLKIINKDFEQGMSTSIKCGLKNPENHEDIFDGDAVMLILGDMPFVNKHIIDSLIEGMERSDKNIAVPVKDEKRGNPVLIGKKYFNDLLSNTGDKGARDIIRNNLDDIVKVQIDDEGIFIDIDDEETYKRYIGL